MGNVQTTQTQNGKIDNKNMSVKVEKSLEETIRHELTKDFEMEKNIIDLGKRLYSEYNQFLLNPQFCDSVSIILAKNLETIPIQTLKNHQRKIEENGAKLVIQYKPIQPNENFIVPELQKALDNQFVNQKINQDIQFKNVKVALPKIEYIQKRILDILEYQSKRSMGFQHQKSQSQPHQQTQEGGKKKKFRKHQQYQQQRNIKKNVDNGNLDELIEGLKNLAEEVNNENNNENENVNENNEDDNENEENENDEDNNKNEENNNNNENGNENENNEDGNNENKNINEEEINSDIAVNEQEPDKISGVEKTVNVNKTKNEDIFENKGKLKNLEVEIIRNKTRSYKNKNKNQEDEEEITMEDIRGTKTYERNKELRKEEKIESKKEEKIEFKKEEHKYEKKDEKVNNKNKNKNENNENEENEDEKARPIGKAEICKKIAKHYTIRLNIIAAILSTVPSINWQTKKPEGGFCSRRINSVRQGNFCLPPTVELEKAGDNDEERLKQIMRYMNYLDEASCDTAGGIYRKLNPDELNSLLYSNHQFNKLYLKYGMKLQSEYEKSLEQLKEALRLLENAPLSNENLNDIAKNTKSIINDMYVACQLNYLLALLIFIDADLRVSTEAYKEKERRRTEYLSTL